MRRYKVKVRRTVEHVTELDIKAEDENEAEELAETAAKDDTTAEWELDHTEYEVEDVAEDDDDPLADDDDDDFEDL